MCNIAVSLVLLLDVSGSVGNTAFERVKEAHAQAFQSPAVVRAIEANGIQATVILYGSNTQVAVPWTRLYSVADIRSFSASISGMTRGGVGSTTNTASGLREALSSLERAPCNADNHVIDLATDADRDAADALREQRDQATAMGVTINVILDLGAANAESAENYTREYVLTPTGFLIMVGPDDDYQTGLRRKLLLEIG
jgi:Protein of unknown function (DUF1194)